MKRKAVLNQDNSNPSDHVVHETLIVNEAANPNIGTTTERKGATSDPESAKNDQTKPLVIEKRPSIWDSFDISKLRNAGEKLKYHQPEKKQALKVENATGKPLESDDLQDKQMMR
ncbi:hypothetical protein RIF29_37740 [Crotalaria pallida]|uniref:Uncharacterized protein n=1 Tax=Crotalaria pallida TaxID=3830 RepID=A0AAN9HRN4_CROPI